MRDALLLLVILSAVPLIVRYPFTGLLAWAWFSLMAPHQLAYGVYGAPLNLIIASVTIAAVMVRGEMTKASVGAIGVLAILFGGWLYISQLFSLDTAVSAEFFDRFFKTMMFVVLCIIMADNKLKINALLWMLVASIGFFAAKGALFTIVTFGQYRVQGLPQTILEDNNHLGIAMATILPLILYLRGEAAHKWMRRGLLALFFMTVIAIIGTHSRGAFISMLVFGGYFWLRSSHKFSIIAALALITIPTVALMPAKWTERMTTITTATDDASFMGRVDAWVINTKLAVENPITGAGLRTSYLPAIASRVDPVRASKAKAGHSIYFEVLGGMGFVGLLIYLSMLGSAFFTAGSIYRRKRNNMRPPWSRRMAYSLQMSLAIFIVGGASASMEMWDGYLLVVALIAALSQLSTITAKAPTLMMETPGKGSRRRRAPALQPAMTS